GAPAVRRPVRLRMAGCAPPGAPPNGRVCAARCACGAPPGAPGWSSFRNVKERLGWPGAFPDPVGGPDTLAPATGVGNAPDRPHEPRGGPIGPTDRRSVGPDGD